MDIPFVAVRDFTPNLGAWTGVGRISAASRTGDTYVLTLAGGRRTIQLTFLSPTCYRLRFDPAEGARYSDPPSPAVVKNPIAPVTLAERRSDTELEVDTGAMRVVVGLDPYRMRVYRGAQLVSADEPSYNLVYIPGQKVVANLKTRPSSAHYCGFGEKAGSQLLKTGFTMTQFNYDNFKYVAPTVPSGTDAGPLNPSVALYVSIPFMLELNPAPVGEFAGPPYACGLFLDNPAQTYFNMGSNDRPGADMDGRYYFGALFGVLDTYFFLGDRAADILGQYTTLTGRAPMPPKYALGYHQGAYGYFDRTTLERVAGEIRGARIPCDGLHIDVDFQDNYRTFTHSAMKFPDARQMLAKLAAAGFKCSTNVTPLITRNPLDENAGYGPYQQRQALLQAGALIYDTRAGQGPGPDLYEGRVNYGVNRLVPGTGRRFNPYPSPGLSVNADGSIPLSSPGNYPDFGRAEVRKVWGEQYAHLIQDLGISMIWQDMMCPALDSSSFKYATLPLDLMINDGAGYVPEAVAHNAYALFILMGTWDGLAKLRPDKRNFIVARGGYAGMQRYAAAWTGDTGSSWDFLRINLPEVLNLGLSGVPLSGCDIGGFAADPGGSVSEGGTVNVTEYELLTRWMHLGSFLPWYRNHYDGYNKSFQEPHRYGEPVPANCRKFVELRYRMLQLHYDAVFEWTQTGMPPARALFLNEDDPAVFGHLDDQFFVGRDFLVAPILFPGEGSPPVASRGVYLPAGSNWYAFKDGTAALDAPVPGGTTVHGWRAALDQVPIYVREGAIIPMRSLEQYVGELDPNPLDINVYPGRASTYDLYEDDGVTTDAELKRKFRLTRISHGQAAGRRRLELRRVRDDFAGAAPYIRVSLLGLDRPGEALVDGAPAALALTRGELDAAKGNAFFYDPELRTGVFQLRDGSSVVTVETAA